MKRWIVGLVLLFSLESANASILIDNSSYMTNQGFGPDKFGQTITAPPGATALNSLSFFLTSARELTPDTVTHFTLHIYAWSDTDYTVLGPSLFDSTLETTNPKRLGFREHRFDNLDIPVLSGSNYIAFIDQVEFGGIFTRVNYPYTGGQFWATDRAITDTWGLDGDFPERNSEGNSMSFIASFAGDSPPEPPQPPDGQVPEPSTLIIWSLLGTLGMAGGWYRRYSLRRSGI
jgi:hypothetical protein